VKNVTGFDLCRLLVGSLGTIGLIAEVVLRVRPRPQVSRWLRGEVDPFALRRRLHRPGAILWDGTTTWVLLEGHPADVEAQAALAGGSLVEVDGPPPVPDRGRESVRPSALASLTGPFLAEVGVGVVHRPHAVERPAPDPSAAAVHRRIKALFDPTGRLNPGRSVA
jgi:glycolate oxidase FAD binding subunit